MRRGMIGSAGLLAMVLFAGGVAMPATAQDEPPSPASTHYVRTLGPYSIDGKSFTVKLSVICYRTAPHPGECNEDDEETVKWMKIDDESGKTQFHRVFPVAFAHQLERHLVEVTRLEGQDHQALEIEFERLPSRVNTGVSVQVFGLRDGTLQALNEEPLHFYGELGELPKASSEDSRRLLAGDTFPIYLLTNYFYIAQPVSVNWNDFRLDLKESGEFEMPQELHYHRKPIIQAEGYIHLYSSPDKNAKREGISVTPQSKVELVGALFSAGAPEEHSSADDTWLNISIDDKVGWILGADDYTAIGLTPVQ
jgi:hypothetical protein